MEFKPSVKEALGYYVYALVDPRDNKIFYVGKGKGDRVFQHAEEKNQSLKLGKPVTCCILRHKLTEETACTVESTLGNLLINKDFDYEDKLLTNIEGIMTTDERNKLYDCSKIKPRKGEKLLLVSLNKSYPKDAEGVYKRANNYERTRKHWCVSDKEGKYWCISFQVIEKIDCVLGVYGREVKAVCIPVSWEPYNKAKENYHYPNNEEIRFGFEGAEVLDSPYLNKDVSDYLPSSRKWSVIYIPN